MSSTQLVHLVFLLLGGLFVALAIPLIRGRVRPNRLYGVRTPRTLGDERVWYEANRKGGRALAGAGALAATVALVLLAVGWPRDADTAALIHSGVMLLAVAASTTYTLVAIRRM
jgi:uncharacterized membrane protein